MSFLKDLLNVIPTVGRGIEFTEKDVIVESGGKQQPAGNNLVDLSQALYYPTFSLDDSTLSTSASTTAGINQSYLEDDLNDDIIR